MTRNLINPFMANVLIQFQNFETLFKGIVVLKQTPKYGLKISEP